MRNLAIKLRYSGMWDLVWFCVSDFEFVESHPYKLISVYAFKWYHICKERKALASYDTMVCAFSNYLGLDIFIYHICLSIYYLHSLKSFLIPFNPSINVGDFGRTYLKNYTALKFLHQALRYLKTETGKIKKLLNRELRQQMNFPSKEKGQCFLC